MPQFHQRFISQETFKAGIPLRLFSKLKQKHLTLTLTHSVSLHSVTLSNSEMCGPLTDGRSLAYPHLSEELKHSYLNRKHYGYIPITFDLHFIQKESQGSLVTRLGEVV